MSFHTDAYRRLDKTRIPVRSMAPEAVRQNLFCTKENDVYMFSVLIWEMFHRGSDPFGEFEPENLIPDAIGAALIDLYLWERPKPEILPLGMTMNLTNWYLKVDKPEETPIQLHMQIIFNNCRLRNYHHRATFSQSDNPTKRAIIPILQTLDKDYCQNLTADDFFYLRW
uniref:PK_Tyr_Ser-Thr domain-containing protein n=1 Tax=Caenorhabditis japonica TaxID=281687 RepID=A0A8R1DUJ5_CAEJA